MKIILYTLAAVQAPLMAIFTWHLLAPSAWCWLSVDQLAGSFLLMAIGIAVMLPLSFHKP